jgi:hypothetical protein
MRWNLLPIAWPPRRLRIGHSPDRTLFTMTVRNKRGTHPAHSLTAGKKRDDWFSDKCLSQRMESRHFPKTSLGPDRPANAVYRKL